jgi:hypothetical protein
MPPARDATTCLVCAGRDETEAEQRGGDAAAEGHELFAGESALFRLRLVVSTRRGRDCGSHAERSTLLQTKILRLRTRATQRLEIAHEERVSRGEAPGGCFAPAAAAAAAQQALVSQHLRRLSAAPKQVRGGSSNVARSRAPRPLCVEIGAESVSKAEERCSRTHGCFAGICH